MPAIIKESILKSGFEQVLERIGEILLIEWTSQKLKQDLPESVSLFKERTTPIDQSEDLYINVLFSGEEKSLNGQRDSQNRAIYFVDVYTTGDNQQGKFGWEDSSDRLLRYLGIMRYILSYSDYKTLLFEDGLIGGTSVDNISTLDPTMIKDSSFSRMGRITFGVKVLENQTLWQGEALHESITGVKLGTTDKGYKFVLTDN